MKKLLTPRNMIVATSLILSAFILYRIVLEYLPDLKLLLNPSANKDLFVEQFRSHGNNVIFFLILLITIINATPGLSSAFICILSGLTFGPLLGTLVNITGNLLGNLLSIVVMGKFTTLAEKARSKKWVKKIEHSKNPSFELVIAYIIPIIPVFLVNYTLSIFKFSLSKKILIIFLGTLPISIIYAYGGNSILEGHLKGIIILVSFILVIFLLTYYLKKHEDSKGDSKDNS
ncbi:VTT domain-containing protein [Streptococcaceae bacterium ESL0687]|nr:VTT domain-containing protein [Streptococcaceae bacterium ESL0687]